MKTNFAWIKELNFTKHLPDEYNDMIDVIGVDKFLELLERFSKTSIYFSEKPFERLKREYILKNGQSEPKELARKLNVSERFVYGVRSQQAQA